MTITVYSKSGCAQCMFTKKFLEAENIDYEEKRIDLNEDYREELIRLGFKTLPVVEIGRDTIFSGYRPDILNGLVSK